MQDIKKVSDKSLEMDPMSQILGHPSVSTTSTRLYEILTFAARKIKLRWTGPIKDWCTVVYELVPLEYLSILHIKTDQFNKV